jgi:hypothetical protein
LLVTLERLYSKPFQLEHYFFIINGLFVWLTSHHPAVLFSQNKSATSNQPTILFPHNKSAPAISHQPNEQAAKFQFQLCEFWLDTLTKILGELN